MTSIYLENNSTFSNINDVNFKIFVDGEDDEGIDCPLEVGAYSISITNFV